jgi:hypothetical protein
MRPARLLVAVASAALLALATSPARAQLPATPGELCSATGTVDISMDASTGVATWRVGGTGTCTDLTDTSTGCTDRYGNPCTGPGPEPAFTLSGSGTSTGAGGVCDGVLVKDLSIAATLEIPVFWSDPFFGDSGWLLRQENQRWVRPNTAFPGVTPFRIVGANAGRTEGWGVIVDGAVQTCPSQQGHSRARFELLFG